MVRFSPKPARSPSKVRSPTHQQFASTCVYPFHIHSTCTTIAYETPQAREQGFGQTFVNGRPYILLGLQSVTLCIHNYYPLLSRKRATVIKNRYHHFKLCITRSTFPRLVSVCRLATAILSPLPPEKTCRSLVHDWRANHGLFPTFIKRVGLCSFTSLSRSPVPFPIHSAIVSTLSSHRAFPAACMRCQSSFSSHYIKPLVRCDAEFHLFPLPRLLIVLILISSRSFRCQHGLVMD